MGVQEVESSRTTKRERRPAFEEFRVEDVRSGSLVDEECGGDRGPSRGV
jgi:hypothetical protein